MVSSHLHPHAHSTNIALTNTELAIDNQRYPLNQIDDAWIDVSADWDLPLIGFAGGTRSLAICTGLLLFVGCGNGFQNVDHCPDRGCTSCTTDADCVVAVDCCGERNVCSHRDDAIAICRLGCSEIDNPPPVSCRESRCRCG